MKSNLHFLSHNNLLSCNQGELVPIGLMEVLPGDSIQHATSAFLRVQPLLAPIMHKVDVKIHHWFVPMRLIWEDWEDFITGGPDGTDASVLPTKAAPASTGYAISSLADYLGVPPEFPDIQVSALPFRAYALIYNNFYRDQDLQTELTIDLTSGADTTTNVTLQHACWEKDYFTSARTEPQKGTDVALPLTGDAPVTRTPTSGAITGSLFRLTTDNSVSGAQNPLRVGADGQLKGADGTTGLMLDPETGPGSNLIADLSAVTAATVNDLRLATALQRYKENMMRFGSRYIERLRYFGVPPMDARLQLPEYLGGGQQTIQFSEVLQTAEGTDPVGQMAGHGIAAMRSNRYRRYVPEHGYIMTLLTVRPKTIYPQALSRTWLRRTKEDFFTPELAHIGQQEVYDGEVYAGAASQFNTWGYQDRYDEYRRMESRVAGEFRDTLDYWHMARIFTAEPNLNSDFVTATPTDRVYAAPSADQLYVQAIHKVQAKRKVPRTGKSFIY